MDEALLKYLTDSERADWFRAKKRPHTGMQRTLRKLAEARCEGEAGLLALAALRAEHDELLEDNRELSRA